MIKRPLVFSVLAVLAIIFVLHHKPGLGAISGHIGGPFTLTDTHNQRVKDTDFRNRVMLVSVGYSHCPGNCQARLASISAALKSLGSAAEKVAALFITLDPERDTPQALAQYLAPFDARIIGLTGTKPEIIQVLREYHIPFRKQPVKGSPTDYLINYSGNLYVMDGNGKFVSVLHPAATADDIAKALKDALAK